MINQIISKQIREQRMSSGLTQIQLSNKIGFKSNMIAKYEDGTVEPSISVLHELHVKCGFTFTLNNNVFTKK